MIMSKPLLLVAINALVLFANAQYASSGSHDTAPAGTHRGYGYGYGSGSSYPSASHGGSSYGSYPAASSSYGYGSSRPSSYAPKRKIEKKQISYPPEVCDYRKWSERWADIDVADSHCFKKRTYYGEHAPVLLDESVTEGMEEADVELLQSYASGQSGYSSLPSHLKRRIKRNSLKTFMSTHFKNFIHRDDNPYNLNLDLPTGYYPPQQSPVNKFTCDLSLEQDLAPDHYHCFGLTCPCGKYVADKEGQAVAAFVVCDDTTGEFTIRKGNHEEEFDCTQCNLDQVRRVQPDLLAASSGIMLEDCERYCTSYECNEDDFLAGKVGDDSDDPSTSGIDHSDSTLLLAGNGDGPGFWCWRPTPKAYQCLPCGCSPTVFPVIASMDMSGAGGL